MNDLFQKLAVDQTLDKTDDLEDTPSGLLTLTKEDDANVVLTLCTLLEHGMQVRSHSVGFLARRSCSAALHIVPF